jgi:hypothetical protein
MEMDAQAPDFEKRFQTYDEDMRGSLAFTTLVDKSRGLANTIRFDIHLSRTYRKSLDEFRLMRKFTPVEHALACSSDLLPQTRDESHFQNCGIDLRKISAHQCAKRGLMTQNPFVTTYLQGFALLAQGAGSPASGIFEPDMTLANPFRTRCASSGACQNAL